MKLRKQLKLLMGITAIRVQQHMTQAELALYLGVSKSLISMVENGHRSLPLSALKKLADLQIRLCKARTAGESDVPSTVVMESPRETTMRPYRKRANRANLAYLKSSLVRMTDRYDSIQQAILQIECLLRFPAGEESVFDIKTWTRHTNQLQQRLDNCGLYAQAKLRGKIAMLETMVALDESQPEISMENGLLKEDQLTGVSQLSPTAKKNELMPLGYKIKTENITEAIAHSLPETGSGVGEWKGKNHLLWVELPEPFIGVAESTPGSRVNQLAYTG